MLGRSHALSGLAAGAAYAEFVQHARWPGVVALGGLTAGTVLLLDLDSCGSTGARSLGLLSGAVSHVVRFVSGGHRLATHSLAGIAAFTGLAWLAAHYRHDYAGMAGLALLLTLCVSSALEALHLAGGHIADVIGVTVAAGVTWYGSGLALVPLAVLIGCVTHIAGDMCTDSGCNLAWPFTRFPFRLLPEPFAFSTGSVPERVIVDPLLCGAVGVLAWLLVR